jgi:hypothetical protein
MGKLEYTTAQVNAKLAPIKHKSVTISVASWSGTAGPYSANITDSDIVDGCKIDSCPTFATQDIADEAGLYADIQETVGNLTLLAKSKPIADITIKYSIQI